MFSVFEEADRQANPNLEFWQECSFANISDLQNHTLFEGELEILKNQNYLKAKRFVLTTTSLYYLSKSSQIKKFAFVAWKTVQAFTEEKGADKRFGFRLGKGSIFYDFYAQTNKELDIWLNFLNSICILSDIEEDYVIIKKIGKGNYAKVYLVQDVDNFEEFALKSISKKKLLNSTRGVSAVVNEINIMKKLHHPNLAAIYRVYESEKHVHLILDYVSGGDLFQRLLKKVNFTEYHASCFIKNLLEALSYMHGLKIVHRDLKPENILMMSSEDDTKIKLVDFGLACEIKNNGFLKCGSPGYVAPEILRNMPYGTKIDVFSAGVILYIVLCGRVPFAGNAQQDVLQQNKQCKIYFKAKHWKNISRAGIDLVLKMTDPNPGTRISAREALEHPWIRKQQPAGTSFDTFSQSQPINLNSDGLISHAMMERLNNTTRGVTNYLPLPVPFVGTNSESKEEIPTSTTRAFQLLLKLRKDDMTSN